MVIRWGKSMMIRHTGILWVLSIAFELMEITFQGIRRFREIAVGILRDLVTWLKNCRNAFSAILLLLAVVQVAWSYVQFQQVLVPFSEDQENIIATRRVTIGSYTSEGFHKIARTRELLNCVLPGCTLMGEVLDIRQNNITSYDHDTLEMNVRTVRNRRGRSVERMVGISFFEVF